MTATQVPHAPQYTVTIRNWRAGADAGAAGYTFENATGAIRREPAGLGEIAAGLPQHFTTGDAQ